MERASTKRGEPASSTCASHDIQPTKTTMHARTHREQERTRRMGTSTVLRSRTASVWCVGGGSGPRCSRRGRLRVFTCMHVFVRERCIIRESHHTHTHTGRGAWPPARIKARRGRGRACRPRRCSRPGGNAGMGMVYVYIRGRLKKARRFVRFRLS